MNFSQFQKRLMNKMLCLVLRGPQIVKEKTQRKSNALVMGAPASHWREPVAAAHSATSPCAKLPAPRERRGQLGARAR